MKTLKTMVKNLKVRYYKFMIDFHVDALESTQCEYGESHKKSKAILKIITKYKNKLDKITKE